MVSVFQEKQLQREESLMRRGPPKTPPATAESVERVAFSLGMAEEDAVWNAIRKSDEANVKSLFGSTDFSTPHRERRLFFQIMFEGRGKR
jgi:hypothetical protein